MDIKKLNEALEDLKNNVSEQEGEDTGRTINSLLGKIKQKLIKVNSIFELNALVAMIEHIFANNGLMPESPLEDGEFSFFRTRQMAITHLKELLEGAVEAVGDASTFDHDVLQAYSDISKINVPKLIKWLKHFMKITLRK